MCHFIGLAGIFIATPISRLVSTGVIDPYLIYKRTFQRNVLEYFGMFVGYLVLFIAIALLSEIVISKIMIFGWIGVVVKAIVVTIIFNFLMIIIFAKTKMFEELSNSVKIIFLKRN